MPASEKPFRVIIIGGGIAGLATAHALTLAEIDYVILEKRENLLEPNGAGVGAWPPNMPLLKQIGVYDTLAESTTRLKDYHQRRPDGSSISSRPLFDMIADRHEGKVFELYDRATLVETLYNKLPNNTNKIRVGCNIVSIEQNDDCVIVYLEDGSKEVGDIVIGADGVNSKVREIMWEHAKASAPKTITKDDRTILKTRYKGIYGLSAPLSNAEPYSWTETHHEGYMFQLFTQPTYSCWIIYIEVDKPVLWPERLHFTDADAEAVAEKYGKSKVTNEICFEHLWKTRTRSFMAGIEEGVQKRWHSGRIVLLGDSVHKMTPNLGLGANQSFESVAVLANLLHQSLENQDSNAGSGLGHSTLSQSEITKIFTSYQEQRYSRAILHYQISGQWASLGAWRSPLYRYISLLPRWMGGYFEYILAVIIAAMGRGAPHGLNFVQDHTTVKSDG